MAAAELLAAVVLAAGSGQRLGGVAKPLIRIDDQPIVCRLVHALQAAGIGRISVVIGPHTRAVRQALSASRGLQREGLSLVELADGHGQMHSLREGLASVADSGAGVVVCLADMPLIDEPGLLELKQAFGQRPLGTDMVVPCVQARPGNPVVLSAPLVRAWLAPDAGLIGQHWRQANPQRVHLWPTARTQYTTDLDTPEDLQALRQSGLDVRLP